MKNKIELFVWERGRGWWFPFPKEECAECSIESGMLNDMKKKEFKGKDVVIERKPYFEWKTIWYTLKKGGYHPPILIVNGKLFHQFSHRDKLFNREKLARVIE